MDKEQQIQLLRDTMIRQECVFKQQVRELHRLYRKQKALMYELKLSKKNRGVTRDFLRSLASANAHGRVKRLKTLDLEQLPDDNDEEAFYVPHVTRAENSTLDFRETCEVYRLWDCEAASPGDSQTLSLFPIPSRGPSSAASAFTGPDSDLRSSIRFCQPFNQGVDQHWQQRTRSCSFGDDAYGARLIGQLVGERLVQATMKTPLGQKDYTPMPRQQQLNLKAGSSMPPPFFPAWTSIHANRVQHYTDGLKNSLSYVVNPTKPPLQPVFHVEPVPKQKMPDFSAANVSTLDVDHLHKAKPSALALPGVENNTPNRSFLGETTSATITTGTTTITSCTDRNTTAVRALSTDSLVVQGLDVNLNEDTGYDDPVELSIIGNRDTTTRAATILLSLAPENCKLEVTDAASKQVEASSSLLSSDVKLFKSVVIMLKQQQKASRKVVVKGAACNNQGKAAKLLETLKAGSQEKVNNNKVTTQLVSNGGKSFTARHSACNWQLWGDVTRRKRTLQRHRSNHPQPVRCFN